MRAWTRIIVCVIAISASLCSAPLRAQQDNADKPKPAARVLLPLPDLSGDQQDSDQSDQTMQPDHGPVGGVQNPTLGTSELRHSYWVPGIQYGNATQSAPPNAGASALGWSATNFVSGNLSMVEAWAHDQFAMNYSGGGSFSQDETQGNSQYHQLASAFEMDQRRWQLLFIDQFSYLPQSSFGFGGATALAFPGITGTLAVPLPTLQNMFVPGQSIISTSGSRYSNAGAAQLTYATSRRGAITVAGVHGLLHFINSGNINSDNEILNVAYNYAITRKDYIGVIYRFNAFHYAGNPQALGDHSYLAGYGRRITGRLALNLAGGPEMTYFRVPVNGSNQKISGSGTASMSYAFRLSSVKLNYSHGVSSGSGLFSGANTDLVSASWSRPLIHLWNGTLSLGYSRNKQVVDVKGLSSPSYSSWLPTAGISRPVGSNASFSIGYQAQIQTATVLLCGTPNCGTTYMTHQIQLSLLWHASPLVLR